MAKDKIYQQVAAFLKRSIESGELKAGEAIYSENLLCEKLGVSRTSVRKAIRMMVEANILESHQGKGTFIKNCGNGKLFRYCSVSCNHTAPFRLAFWRMPPLLQCPMNCFR